MTRSVVLLAKASSILQQTPSWLLWLWELKDVAVIGIGLLLSVLALTQGAGMFLLVVTVMYAFLSIRTDGASILDYLRCAVCFLFLHQQYFEWRQTP